MAFGDTEARERCQMALDLLTSTNHCQVDILKASNMASAVGRAVLLLGLPA